MKNRLLTLLTLALLMISMPALMAAAPGEHHHKQDQPQRQALDWKSYPADIQAIKVQFDEIRTQQKGLFEQIKSQHEQIRATRKTITSDQRKALKTKAKPLILKMKSSRDAIQTLREQKHKTWDSFHKHAESKQWSDAKSDLQMIVKQKQQILDEQRSILTLQKQLIALVKPSTQTQLHL